MIVLDSGDKIRGDAAAATVVDYTIHGFDRTNATWKQLSDGQLPSSTGDLYTSTSVITNVVSIILVNTDTSARAVNLFLLPSGGTARRIIPKDLSLGVGYSLHTDGVTVSVYDASGVLQVKVGGGLNNIVEDTTPQLGGDLDLNSKNIDFPSTANISDVKDEDNMASDSPTMLATQQSIKAYADTKIASLVADTTPQLGGALDMNEKSIDLTEALDADGKYSGFTCQGVYGDTLAYGDLIYLNDDDQRWEKADADAKATAGPVQLGIALESGTDGQSKLVFLWGFIREDDWAWNVGDTLFVSTTAGAMQQTAPSGSADIVRAVGNAHDDADTIFFSPSQVWLEIA